MPAVTTTVASSTDQSRVPFAHELRGVAVLAVMAFHYLGLFWQQPAAVAQLLGVTPLTPTAAGVVLGSSFGPSHWFSLGHFGVALFFLVSGFVIPFAFVRQSRVAFVIGRFWRLWPTYAVGLTCTVVLVALVRVGSGTPLLPSASTLAWNYALGLRDLAGAPSLDGVVWTLEIEIRFYLLCLVLAPALRDGRPGPVVGALLAVAAIAGGAEAVSATHGHAWTLANYTAAVNGPIVIVMLLGTLGNLWFRRTVSRSLLAAGAATGAAACLVLWQHGPLAPDLMAMTTSYAAAAAVFVVAYLRGSAPGPTALWSRLADISYPLYVVHAVPGYVVLHATTRAGAPLPLALACAVAWALASATVVHRVIEVPSRVRGRVMARS